MSDTIESHILKEENKPVAIEDLEYHDVFPEDREADPNSIDAVIDRLMQNNPDADINGLIEKAKKIADSK